MEAQKAVVNDYKKKVDDLSKQLVESKQLTHKTGDNFLVIIVIISLDNFKAGLKFTNSFCLQLNEKLNEMMAKHQNVLSEKDKQLLEYQKQIEALQKTSAELTTQIEEQKVKNNVSATILNMLPFFLISFRVINHSKKLLTLFGFKQTSQNML